MKPNLAGPDALKHRVATLERQVELLLRSLKPGAPRRAPPGQRDTERATLDLLEQLRTRTGRRYTRGGASGAVGYAGFIRVDGRRYAWARETTVPDLLDANANALARLIGAVGSPQRIALLRSLFGRDRTSAELAHVLGDASAGHVYHHLKELQATGILVQADRGVYRIAPSAFLPVLMVLAAASDILTHRSGDVLEPFPQAAAEVDS